MTCTLVPDDDFLEICAGMEAAEKAGLFNEMFKVECRSSTQSISKEVFLEQMHAGMRLYKSTFKRIYGWEISYPGFAEQAISRLEALGCNKARHYYEAVRDEIEEQYNQDLKEAGGWYRQQCEKDRKELQRKAGIWSRESLKKMSNSELLTYLESLIAEA